MGGRQGPVTALLHPLPLAPGDPALRPREVFQVVLLPSLPLPGPGKLHPPTLKLLDAREGAGSRGRWGTRCWFSEEERRLRRPLSHSGPELLLQAARGGRGMGSEAAAAGGRRLEAGVGGGAGGRPRAAGWGGRRAEDCGSHPPHDQPLPQHPHSLPPGLCAWGSEGHCIWGHRDADKDACGRERVSVRREQGRCLGVGTEGDLSSEDCRAWAEPLRRGRWSLVGLCSRPSPKMRVRDVLDAGTQ